MFHKSTLGSFGTNLPCDMGGMVPELGDEFEDMTFSSDWNFDDDEWEAWVDAAIEATYRACKALHEWQTGSSSDDEDNEEGLEKDA